MFGYLRPEREELKIREDELYKSVYCGLCRHLGRDYGRLSRLTLSYDCTVLTMLSLGLTQEACSVKRGRCVVNPTKKCLFCDCEGQSFRMAGAVSVIMTYYKLTDTIADSGFCKRTAARLLRRMMKRSFRKAAAAYPAVAAEVERMMQAQQQAEQQKAGLDRAADPTGQLLAALCRSLVPEGDPQQGLLSEFGYYLGRWIYLIDAADDLEKDVKHHNFNPFIPLQKEAPQQTMLYCNDVLNMTTARLTAAYDLLQLGAYQEILDNVVHLGLSLQQKHCLFEKKLTRKQRRQARKSRELYAYLSQGDSR